MPGMDNTEAAPATENRHIEDRLFRSEDNRPHLLTLRIEARPPTWNGVAKAHHQTRGRIRREWKEAAKRALGVALAYDGLPSVADKLLEEYAGAAREERERLLRAHAELQARCFPTMVHVEARPQYQSGRSVPDPDGIGPAVKWALDVVTENGCLVTDTRHHVRGIYMGGALIVPDGGPDSLRLSIESEFLQ